MEIVRLGAGRGPDRPAGPAAIERTRVALTDYARRHRTPGADRVRMVATSATRDAANAAEFRSMVLETLGVAPEVMTGDEEAGCPSPARCGASPSPGRRYLVVDIGGGSTEFVLGDRTVEQAISVDIGCVRMTERHLHDDPPTPAQMAAAKADITPRCTGRSSWCRATRPRTVVGLAGSVTTVTASPWGCRRTTPSASTTPGSAGPR